MDQFEVEGMPRSEVGKSANRRLRKEGKVPGVVYGAHKPTQNLSLWHHTFANQLESEAFYSHVLTLKVGDKSDQVVLKNLQRHPFKPKIMHVDFQYISAKETLTMRVPIHFINEDTCIGVKDQGGVISHIASDIEVQCLPQDLPEFIAIDLKDLTIGDTIYIGDLSLPSGVENYNLLHGGDPMQPVVSVHMPKIIVEEEPTETEEVAEDASEDSDSDSENDP